VVVGAAQRSRGRRIRERGSHDQGTSGKDDRLSAALRTEFHGESDNGFARKLPILDY